MRFKSLLAKPFAAYIFRKTQRDTQMDTAIALQEQWRKQLIQSARDTLFGKAHGFADIKNHTDFKQQIPISDYEGVRPYIDCIIKGEHNVLWKGRPIYFAKTSGTTSGVKYIPITKDSIGNHIHSTRNALLNYIHETGHSRFVDGKMMFLSGSPTLSEKGGIPTGRLSGIVNHHIPAYLRSNQLPTYETNCIADWETKVAQVVKETIQQELTTIGGIPPWVQMYFDQLMEQSGGKTVTEIFPNLQLLIHGGVNFKPYQAKMEAALGRTVDSIELYPASEGFFAYQNSQYDEGLLLNINSGIFFEFIPANEIFNENPTRLHLGEVELGVNYALIINSNAGLWGYNIGDTVKFVSKNPYKIRVSGRIKHFISAFGEHVIGEEVERALLPTAQQQQVAITEFTVAPKIQTEGELPYHEWLIEFEQLPDNLTAFALQVDEALQKQNIYYADLIEGKILQPLKITPLQKGAFQAYMKSVGRLGGQNKVPRLANHREIADFLNNSFNSRFA